MSWMNELISVYNRFAECNASDASLLPISHSTAKAQIQVTLDEDGNFISADTVTKEEAETIIPVTEDSGTRSRGICPMPLADKLIYIAGDYSKYAVGKKADNKDYFSAYIRQLKQWSESEFSHPAVTAIYRYLSKAQIMCDLVNAGILKCENKTGKLEEKIKISGIAQEDAFVRFCVNYVDLSKSNETWKDCSLYEGFIGYNRSRMNNIQLCYATGKKCLVTYKHPHKIRNSGDKAKLISANDESGFTYRGRFKNKEETISVGYEASQKMHNALKWLIARQGMSFGTMTVVAWTQTLEKLPDLTKNPIDWKEEDDDFDNNEVVIDSGQQYKELIQQMIFSYRSKLKPNTKVMIMAVDAATTGRLSIAMYAEWEESRFYHNLERWHTETATLRYNRKKNCNEICSFGIYDIANSAYGTEQNERLVCDKNVFSKVVLRLFSCMTEGTSLPADIMMCLYYNASNPSAYEKNYNHRQVLETACGMIRKMNIEKKKGVISLAYDPNETNRSYLFGCLLAIADKAEREAYEEEDRNKRVTTARRYWNRFSQNPYQTWQRIEEHLNPYFDKLKEKSVYYQVQIQKIMDKMTLESFEKNQTLEPEYLIGYHHFMAYMYSENKESRKEGKIE
ncbi:MAG: type I-C CRISPR-associated protein Cas8c/Csd1 [Clostridiales bacterium]|nr:type I-C CRISPR-associated protein Cas8c/Csd1 [Clostridiales bacterium]